MPAITIRNLPDSVHAALKQQAAAEKLSVEALVRRRLAEPTHDILKQQDPTPMTGFSEAQAPWATAPAKSPLPDLWGALQGTVHIPPGTDLAAPLGEPWDAES